MEKQREGEEAEKGAVVGKRSIKNYRERERERVNMKKKEMEREKKRKEKWEVKERE